MKKSRTAKTNLSLFLIALPGIIYLLINNYAPMLGIFLAFKNYSLMKGPFGSDWCGFDNFEFLFKTKDAWIMTRNTLLYNTACKGIATALVPTVDVIRRTAELGCNLLVVHEPIFYSTEDYPDWRAGGTNSVYEEKKALLEKYGITVWRDHDHMHAHNPDSIFTGVMKYLGLEKYYVPSEESNIKVPMGYLFELPETTVEELGRYLEEKLNMNGLRIVGNPMDKIRKVAIVGHLFPGFGAQTETTEYGTDLINAMEQGLDAIIPGEIIEWTVVSYVRDALALGRNKAIFNIGHFNMEELGMRY